MLVTFLIAVTNMPNKSNLRKEGRKEGFIMVRGVKVQPIMMGTTWR